MTPATSKAKRSIAKMMKYALYFLLYIAATALSACFEPGAIAQTIGQSCTACHANSNPPQDQSHIGLNQATLFLGLTDGSPQHESTNGDIHASAAGKVWDGNTLTPAFQSIVDRLGWTNESLKFKNECLTCHAGIKSDSSKDYHPGRPEVDFIAERNLSTRNSIGCEACHGRGDKYYLEHLAPNWLSKTVQDKRDKGFLDLGNSAIAAQVCLSCHLGSPEESKVVTHQMYAAGHPPLPPVDLSKFLDSTCKKHWLDLKEKAQRWSAESKGDQQTRIAYLKNHLQSPAIQSIVSDQTDAIPRLSREVQDHFPKTQQSMVGQLTANLLSHDLMLHNAQSENLWGDYAIYDCVGCHQTLYKQLRRSNRNSGSVPGRPKGMQWTRSTLATFQRGELLGLGSLQIQIDHELNVTPFGSRERIESVLMQASEQRIEANSKLVALATKQFGYREASDWMRDFLIQKRDSLGNEWVAKQVFWTLDGYFVDLRQYANGNPEEKLQWQNYHAPFAVLSTESPPISHLQSCRSSKAEQDTTRSGDYQAFYKRLQAFVDELLGRDD